MTQTGDLIHPQLRSLCPRVCTNCDYALEGLVSPATCPECGMAEDPSVLTLAGWTQPPTRLMSRWGKGWTIFSYVAAGLFLLAHLGRGRGVTIETFWWLFIILGPVSYTTALAFFRGVRGAPLRLRVSPAGFEKRVGPGPVHLRPWRDELAVQLRSQGKDFWSVQTKWAGEHFALVSTSNFIMFYFQASMDQAYALKDQLTRWIAESEISG